MNTVPSSPVLRSPPMVCAVAGALLGVVAVVASSQLLGGLAVSILSVAWLLAVRRLFRSNARMPMRDGSWITKQTNPMLYRFWMGMSVLFGLAGLLVAFTMVRDAV